jgi:hypothetical protein
LGVPLLTPMNEILRTIVKFGFLGWMEKPLNSKHEIRNSKQYQMTKYQNN